MGEALAVVCFCGILIGVFALLLAAYPVWEHWRVVKAGRWDGKPLFRSPQGVAYWLMLFIMGVVASVGSAVGLFYQLWDILEKTT